MKTIRVVWVVLLTLSTARCGTDKPSSTTATAGSEGGSGGTAGTVPTGGAGGAPVTPPQVTILGLSPVAISADGSVVVGRDFQTQSSPLRWTAATGAEPLAGLSDFDVRGISADGSTIVGDTISLSGQSHAARVVGGTRTDIAFPRSTDTDGHVIAVSRDGSAIAGSAWSLLPTATSSQAFRWTVADGVVGLGFLAGDGASETVAMSPDGETIVGLSYDLAQLKARPFRWTKATGMAELPSLAGSSLTLPVAVNDAGTAIGDSYVGGDAEFSLITNATSQGPILWTQGPPSPIAGCSATFSAAAAIAADGTTLAWCQPASLVLVSPGAGARLLSLPPPPPSFSAGDQSVFPQGMSGDGSVVVGRYDLGSIGGTANILAVWTGAAMQPSLLAQTVAGTPGAIDLPNPNPVAVSEDGSTIVGGASGPAGWLLRLR